MSNWKEQKEWSDRFLPEIKGILGQTFIGAAPPEEDMEHNTDLMVYRMEPLRIACRIRKEGYFGKYGHEFTIRASVSNGSKTEFHKIIEGWGDYFFYGFGNKQGKLVWWSIGNLRVFNVWVFAQLVKNQGQLPGKLIPNKDGLTEFRAFKWKDLPSNFVVTQAAEVAYTKTESPTPPPTEAQAMYFEDTKTFDQRNQRSLF